MFGRLRDLALEGEPIRVAVVGTGFVGRGLVYQVGLTPAMTCSVVVARRTDQGVAALVSAGHEQASVVVSDDADRIRSLIPEGVPIVTSSVEAISGTGVDVVVEATGDVAFGAQVAVTAILGGMHLVSLNYETDATVGPVLKRLADKAGVVYTGSDGDQPGVMMRMIDYVGLIGLDVVAAVNCKGFMDIHATPETIRPWAKKQGTSLLMTTAFTDGTKMNVENVCVANASGLVPELRGMHGVETTLQEALSDFTRALSRTGVVDYTLGGDFGSGIFVIGAGADPEMAAPYFKYLKMGDGPWYLFFRPWHLVHFETPISIADAYLDGQATVAPRGEPVAEVVAIAKRDLEAGTFLDGIGGFDCYGEIDDITATRESLPIGISEAAVVTRPVAADEPITLADVELDDRSALVRLWQLQGESSQSDDDLTGAVSRIWGVPYG